MANRYTILVVDDERIMIELTGMVLRSHNYNVITFSKAIEAFNYVKENNVDLVLADYMMPGMDGVSLLNKIKVYNKLIPVIIMTGKGSEEIATGIMKAGASDYILKPYSNQDLIERIEHVLYVSQIEKQNQELIKEKDSIIHQLIKRNEEIENSLSLPNDIELFTRSIIHDLNNSNTLIHQLACALIKDIEGDVENSRLFKYLKNIEKRSTIMGQDLFKLRAIMHNNLSVRKKKSSLKSILNEAIEIVSFEEVKIKIYYDSSIDEIYCDYNLLVLLLRNLIENSVQAMPDGGTICIHVYESSGNTIQFKIRDEGCGISDIYLDKVFQIDFSTKSDGCGLGLYLVKEIVKLHNGKINIRSEINKWTEISMQFPVEME